MNKIKIAVVLALSLTACSTTRPADQNLGRLSTSSSSRIVAAVGIGAALWWAKKGLQYYRDLQSSLELAQFSAELNQFYSEKRQKLKGRYRIIDAIAIHLPAPLASLTAEYASLSADDILNQILTQIDEAMPLKFFCQGLSQDKRNELYAKTLRWVALENHNHWPADCESFKIHPHVSLTDLKEEISKKTGIPPEEQFIRCINLGRKNILKEHELLTIKLLLDKDFFSKLCDYELEVSRIRPTKKKRKHEDE